MVSSSERPQVLSLIPGRMRLHLPGWTAGDGEQIEARLYRVKGIESVQGNPLTGNLLIRFDCRTTGEQELLAVFNKAFDGLRGAAKGKAAARDDVRPPVTGGGALPSSVLRVGVRGLLGHAAVDSLWFAAGFLGKSVGLPLGGLGPLHLLMDVAVWGMALRSGAGRPRSPAAGNQPAASPQRDSPSAGCLDTKAADKRRRLP